MKEKDLKDIIKLHHKNFINLLKKDIPEINSIQTISNNMIQIQDFVNNNSSLKMLRILNCIKASLRI